MARRFLYFELRILSFYFVSVVCVEIRKRRQIFYETFLSRKHNKQIAAATGFPIICDENAFRPVCDSPSAVVRFAGQKLFKIQIVRASEHHLFAAFGNERARNIFSYFFAEYRLFDNF